MMVKLGDILFQQPKSKIKAGEGLEKGTYRFFTSSNIQTKYIDTYQYDGPALIFGTGGSASVHYCEEKFATSTDCLVFYAYEEYLLRTIYYYLSGNIEILEKGFKGAGLKHISKQYILDVDFLVPSFEKQRKIVDTLDKINDLIAKRKQQLEKLDLLVKSKFVEIFGDPVSNPNGWQKVCLSDLADIRIGPFGSLLHKEDYIIGGHALVNPSHIIDGKISTDEKLTISKEKYNELKPYQLEINDVVMGRRGEMGRCAVVDKAGLLCGTGSLIIRTKGEVRADYIQKIISFPTFKKTIEDMAVGQTMPNLNVPIVSRFQIIKPPLDVQNSYYKFVEYTEKTKTLVHQSLEKYKMLKKALMQEYFR